MLSLKDNIRVFFYCSLFSLFGLGVMKSIDFLVVSPFFSSISWTFMNILLYSLITLIALVMLLPMMMLMDWLVGSMVQGLKAHSLLLSVFLSLVLAGLAVLTSSDMSIWHALSLAIFVMVLKYMGEKMRAWLVVKLAENHARAINQ